MNLMIYLYVLSAIDMTRDIFQALETVISLGFERVLTSGGDSSVLEGLPVITEMIEMVLLTTF